MTVARYTVDVHLPDDYDLATVHTDPEDGPMTMADEIGVSIRMAILHSAACESWPARVVMVGTPTILADTR